MEKDVGVDAAAVGYPPARTRQVGFERSGQSGADGFIGMRCARVHDVLHGSFDACRDRGGEIPSVH
jgi:hypothetical protein